MLGRNEHLLLGEFEDLVDVLLSQAERLVRLSREDELVLELVEGQSGDEGLAFHEQRQVDEERRAQAQREEDNSQEDTA